MNTNADAVYARHLEAALSGTLEYGNVRAHWPDGTPAPTRRVFNVCTTYHNIETDFPILKCRPVSLKRTADEMIWIFQKKSTDIHDLKLSSVWDQWADEHGNVGKTYGYQAGRVYDFGGKVGEMDQVDRALWMLKNDPMSRHIIINLWNPADYKEMNLAPCCCWLQFNVRHTHTDGQILDMVLYQRSWDLIAAGGWDVVAHSLLLMMFAWACDMKPGNFTHFVSNMHIYDRHFSIAEQLVESYKAERKKNAILEMPKVHVDPAVPHDFYAFTPDSFVFDGEYKPYGKQPKFEVAI